MKKICKNISCMKIFLIFLIRFHLIVSYPYDLQNQNDFYNNQNGQPQDELNYLTRDPNIYQNYLNNQLKDQIEKPTIYEDEAPIQTLAVDYFLKPDDQNLMVELLPEEDDKIIMNYDYDDDDGIVLLIDYPSINTTTTQMVTNSSQVVNTTKPQNATIFSIKSSSQQIQNLTTVTLKTMNTTPTIVNKTTTLNTTTTTPILIKINTTQPQANQSIATTITSTKLKTTDTSTASFLHIPEDEILVNFSDKLNKSPKIVKETVDLESASGKMSFYNEPIDSNFIIVKKRINDESNKVLNSTNSSVTQGKKF